MADPLGSLKKKNPLKPFDPGDDTTGKAVRAHREAMEELNPKTSSSPVSAPPKPTNFEGKPSPKTNYGAHPERGEKPIPDSDLKQMMKPLGSMKKGGKVPKTGIYQLHAGEKVVPAGAAALGGKKSKTPKKGSGKKPHKMVIEHNDDSTFSIMHQHKSPEMGQAPQPDEKFSAPNVKRLKQHVGMTFAPEAEPEAGEQ
jgi:hypothetical protein